MNIRGILRSKYLRKKIECDPEYEKAQKFSKEYEAKGDVDYDWVRLHALDEFHCGESRITAIEAKADSLIKYLGAGSGIAAVLLATAPKWQVVPTLTFVMLALLMAIIALQPNEHPMLPHTSTALKFADELAGNKAIGSFAAKTAVATAGMAIAARYKARLVQRAFWLFFLGMLWLIGYAIIRHH